MQMIDVMKRLAELDAINPNVDSSLAVVQPILNYSVQSSEVNENQQVDEIAPLLALGGSALAGLSRVALPLLSKIGQGIGKGATATAQTAGSAAAPIAGAVARQSPAIAGGAAIYDLYSTVKQKLGLSDTDVNQTFSNASDLLNKIKEYAGPVVDTLGPALMSLVDYAVKNAIPIGVILGLLYGGKKLWDKVMRESLQENNELDQILLLSGNKKLDECGTPMMGQSPATFNISATASNGDEVAHMLSHIMNLAGMKKDDEVVTGQPSQTDSMRSVLDKLNPMDDEETEGVLGTMAGAGIGSALGGPLGAAVGGAAGNKLADEEYHNTPDSPLNPPAVDTDERAHHPNQAGAADGRNLKNHPKGVPESTYETLMKEYQKFLAENNEQVESTEKSLEDILAQFPQEVQDFKDGGDLDYDLESALWDYYFSRGDIKNYDADASEFISQQLADELGMNY